jgi:predicted transcriptional regulator
MARRNNLEIAAEIVGICKDGAKKTWIVYRANLNFKIIKKYLDWLLGSGFLQKDGAIYTTTLGGEDFLDEYDHLKNKLFLEVGWLELQTAIVVFSISRGRTSYRVTFMRSFWVSSL